MQQERRNPPMKRNTSIYITALLLTVLLFCSFRFSMAYAAEAGQEKEPEIVRIGYYPSSQFQEKDENGIYYGYGYDYYMQIQKYTRWEYEFVEASYSECYQMLIDGKIDIMCGIALTEERKAQVLFSDNAVTSSQSELYARQDDMDLYYESFDTFNGRRTAMLKGTVSDEIDEYCERHGITLELLEYATQTEMYQALEDGEVDLIYTTSVNEDLPTKIVAHMEKKPLYYAVKQSGQDILTRLEEALHQIDINNPDFYTQMSEKYMVNGANAAATFTREELEYLRSGQTVYLIVNTDWAPISWYDESSGTYQGIFIDVIERIREYSGLNLVICNEDEFNNVILPAEPEAENNVIAVLADDNAWVVTQNVLMSNHVVDSMVVMVTRRSTHQNQQTEKQRIALPAKFYISWCMERDFPGEQIIYFNTVEECLDAVNRGKADVTYVSELVSNYYLSKLEYSNLFATSNSGYHENLAFAVNKDSQQPLLGILDKSLLCIGNNELAEIIRTNSISEQRMSLRGLYYSNPGMVISMSLVLMLIVLIIILVFIQMHTRRIRLANALKQDEETTKARTEFFMMISHELRTPLNAVAGYLQLAAEQCKNEGNEGTIVEYIRRSRRAARQLSGIAEDMLDYTKISSATAVLHEEVFDIKTTIQGLEQNFALEAEKKNILLEFSVHELEEEYMVGDHLRVEQMMQNILSNAVKFTDHGGSVTTDIRQVRLEDNRVELIFTVKDTGRGMTQENLKIVCAPFQQHDQAYSRTHGGLGLGLYLTKYYLDAMGGRMEAVSELGKGSCFTLYIPLKLADRQQKLSQKPQLTHVRVMIGAVTKEEGQQLQTILKRLGVKSDIQTERETLIRRVLSRSTTEYGYSLCILDEKMLDEENNLVSQLLNMDKAPIIFALTGSSLRVEELRRKPGMKRVLYKPIFQSVLFDSMLEEFGAYDTDIAVLPSMELSGMHVMVVEDNKINADILTQILKRGNLKFTICENGKIAVDTFTASQPDTYQFILMDIQMPVMNGYDAARAIRGSIHPQAASIPIIAVSANAFPEDIENSLQAGMNTHLSKPVDMQTLYETMESYIQNDNADSEND